VFSGTRFHPTAITTTGIPVTAKYLIGQRAFPWGKEGIILLSLTPMNKEGLFLKFSRFKVLE
jgi:hypothetical protein